MPYWNPISTELVAMLRSARQYITNIQYARQDSYREIYSILRTQVTQLPQDRYNMHALRSLESSNVDLTSVAHHLSAVYWGCLEDGDRQWKLLTFQLEKKVKFL
jgi:hypothetical protein